MFFGIRDPGSEIRDPGWEKTRIRDPGWEKTRIRDLGSGINIPDPQHWGKYRQKGFIRWRSKINQW